MSEIRNTTLSGFSGRTPPEEASRVQTQPMRDLRVLTPTEFDELAPSEVSVSNAQLAYLAELNLLAPTSHNTVPQRFVLVPERASLEIWVDREFVLPASDPLGRQASVSVGCGVANTVLGAHSYGLQTNLRIHAELDGVLRPSRADQPRYVKMAVLTFSPRARRSGSELVALMPHRKVVRAEYDDRVELPSPLADKLRAIVAGYTGVELRLIVDRSTLSFIGKLQESADAAALNDEPFAVELGRWLLPNDAGSSIGMRGTEFGLSDSAARRVHEGLLRLEPLLSHEVANMAKAGYVGMRSSSALAVLMVASDEPAHRIAVGMAYQECALALWGEGFATTMHTALVEYERLNLALRACLRTRSRPTALFRVGRPLHAQDWERPYSARPPLSSVLLGADAASQLGTSRHMASI